MNKFFKFTLCAFLFSSLVLHAETKLSVVRTAGKTSITVTGFTGNDPKIAKILTDTLINDLNINGKFDVKTSGKSQTVFSGSFTESGGSVSANGQLTSKGQNLFNETANGKVKWVAHELADKIVEKLTGEPGIATTRITFVSKKGGSKEVYVMDYDGSNAVRLTNDRTLSGAPSISKDGSRVAYTSYKSGYPDVYVHNINGGTRTRIAAFGGLNSGASFSPDGGSLALTLSKDGNPELYVCSSTGGGFSRLTETRGGESDPSWSPDGSKIVYAYDGPGLPQIYVISASGGSGHPLTGSGYNTEPSWAPETAFIAFSRRSGGGFNIMAMNSDGSEVTAYTSGEHPSWAPNGRHLVYARGGGLYILDVSTGRSIQLRQDLGDCSEPSWSGKIR